jgi:branched-chain amino acid transport system permease protein
MRSLQTGFVVIIIAILLALPLVGSAAWLPLLTQFMVFLALAQMWNLLVGFAGIVSIGQHAFFGLGGYALMVFADDLGINPFVSVLLAGAFTALVALPIAAIVFRLRGGYFAIGTLVVADVCRLLVSSSTDWLRGGSGRTLQAASALAPETRIFYTYGLALLVGIGSVALVYALARSRSGLGLTAIRDSETAAASVGIDVNRTKLLVYVVGAFGTGIIGALNYLAVLRIIPDAAFNVQWTAFMIFIVVIGGIGSVEGPIIGTIIFYILREYLSDLGPWSFIIFGMLAIVIMLVAPKGLWGLLRQRFGIELFPLRRKLD